MGLISLTWVLCLNLVKIQLLVIAFFFSVTFSNSRWRPSCSAKLQKIKWLNAKFIVIQSWYNSIETFFQFYTLLFLVRGVILIGL